jgi:hypothetical protein
VNQVAKIASRLTHESSYIFAVLFAGGLIVLLRDPNSTTGAGLAIAAVFVGILGFLVNLIRESYEHLIKQKDEMIKTLKKERKDEIKHSETLRRDYEKNATNGWVSSAPANDDI